MQTVTVEEKKTLSILQGQFWGNLYSIFCLGVCKNTKILTDGRWPAATKTDSRGSGIGEERTIDREKPFFSSWDQCFKRTIHPFSGSTKNRLCFFGIKNKIIFPSSVCEVHEITSLDCLACKTWNEKIRKTEILFSSLDSQDKTELNNGRDRKLFWGIVYRSGNMALPGLLGCLSLWRSDNASRWRFQYTSNKVREKERLSLKIFFFDFFFYLQAILQLLPFYWTVPCHFCASWPGLCTYSCKGKKTVY